MGIFSPSSLFLRTTTPVTKRHGESRILRVHPLHLFRIIQDVDRYQEFLPLCSSSRVHPETISNDGRTFEATLVVGKPPLFSEEYRSRVHVLPEHLRIRTESISTRYGQFDSLRSTWQLRAVPLRNNTGHDKDDHDSGAVDGADKENHIRAGTRNEVLKYDGRGSTTSLPLHYRGIGCHVDLEVEMTVSDPLVVSILDQILMHVAGRQVEAFDHRCGDVPPPSLELFEAAERLEKEQAQILHDARHFRSSKEEGANERNVGTS